MPDVELGWLECHFCGLIQRFFPKVLACSYLNQPIQLVQFDPPLEEGEERTRLPCPVRARRAYFEATACIRRSEQLCYGGPEMGCALSKQRLSHWMVEAIAYA